MDFPSGHHPFASGQHHFASGENNCKKFFAIPQYPHPYIIFWQIKTPDFIFQLLSIISHPSGFILQQTPIQNFIMCILFRAIKESPQNLQLETFRVYCKMRLKVCFLCFRLKSRMGCRLWPSQLAR